MKKIRLLLPALALILAVLACNFPSPAPTSEIPPLDQTVTSIAKTAAALPSTNTPGLVTATASGKDLTSTTVNSPTPWPTATPLPLSPTPTYVSPTPVPPTATLTNTPLPPTATQVPSRPGAHVEAPFLNTPPTLDGDWSEWKDVAREYPATHVVWGKDRWTGEDDLAGSYYVGWDNQYLFLAAKVRDDKYVQNASGADMYKGDSIEILLDTNLYGDFYYDVLSPDDFQIGISPGRPSISDNNPQVYRWFPSNLAGTLNTVTVAVRDEGAIYRLEAAIPWEVFGVTPYRGLRMGFAFSVNDNDAEGQSVQQSMVSNSATRYLADPTTWGEIVLK